VNRTTTIFLCILILLTGAVVSWQLIRMKHTPTAQEPSSRANHVIQLAKVHLPPIKTSQAVPMAAVPPDLAALHGAHGEPSARDLLYEDGRKGYLIVSTGRNAPSVSSIYKTYLTSLRQTPWRIVSGVRDAEFSMIEVDQESVQARVTFALVAPDSIQIVTQSIAAPDRALSASY
jgi:hypothetical protein